MKTDGARGGRGAFRSLGSQPETASGQRDKGESFRADSEMHMSMPVARASGILKGESFRADSEMHMSIVHSILGRLMLEQIKAMAAKAGRNTRKPAPRSVHHDPSHTACPI